MVDKNEWTAITGGEDPSLLDLKDAIVEGSLREFTKFHAISFTVDENLTPEQMEELATIMSEQYPDIDSIIINHPDKNDYQFTKDENGSWAFQDKTGPMVPLEPPKVSVNQEAPIVAMDFNMGLKM